MSSTFIGRTGRSYLRNTVLKAHARNPNYNVHLAHCDNNKPYVVKKVSPSIFEQSLQLKEILGNEPRLRHHVDDNERERLLVYEYFRQDLLSLIGSTPSLSVEARKRILWEVGLGLRTLHSRHWIHLDLKPDNILLDWRNKGEDDADVDVEVDRVVLADLDCALQLQGDKLLNHRIGNVMWRSPEGQAGEGVGKASEVFSYGLLCLFTITGAEVLHPNFEQLKKDGAEPEHVILFKLLLMFGPAPEGLLKRIDDVYWREVLVALSEVVVADEGPDDRFERWDRGMLPNLDEGTKRFVGGMLELDPERRGTMDEVMAALWWDE